MNKLLLATVAAAALATLGVAQAAEKGTGCRAASQLAASGLQSEQGSTGVTSQLAASGLPQPNGAAPSTQLAASGLPQPNGAAPSTQLAASGLPQPNGCSNE